MANLTVQKVITESDLPHSWRDEIEKFYDAIRRKAFQLFERHGRANGHDLDNWFDAEKQLLTFPRSELLDAGTDFELRIAVPGFDAKEVVVMALPDSLLLKARATAQTEKTEGEICYTEFSDQSLFRNIPLPKPIDIDHVTAKLDKGILKIIARKADLKQEEKERKIAVVAA